MTGEHRSYWLELTPEDFVRKPWSTGDFVLARAGAGEGPRCRALWTEVGRGFWTERIRWKEARWRQHLESADRIAFWVAAVGGEDIGFFELCRSRRGVKLEGFGLLPGWRGRGLGGRLLSAATELAFDMGARRVWLHTATDDHPNALPNYRARGYRVVREAPLRNPVGG